MVTAVVAVMSVQPTSEKRTDLAALRLRRGGRPGRDATSATAAPATPFRNPCMRSLPEIDCDGRRARSGGRDPDDHRNINGGPLQAYLD